MNKWCYLRDPWNIPDFAIVLAGWIEYTANSGVNLNALRTIRLLRPLKSISAVQGLRVLFLALLGSMRLLLVFLILFFIFLNIFSISGLHLLMGKFKFRCI